MFFKQRVFKNELTKLLGDPDTTLEMTLLHHEFSITIRNEYEGLYQKILGTENDEYNNEWFKKIIGYALFDAEPPEKEKKNNRIKQINNNASNFLECCGKRFKDALKKSKSDSMDYLMKSLDKFISNKNKTKKDPYYAGHFQRFIENFIRLKAFDDLDEVLDKITPFLIENCYILAYQQLLTRILGDFSATLDDKIVYDLLTKMLFCAYSAVSYIFEHNSDVLSQSAVDVEINALKRENQYKKSQQPLNLNKKSIPLIGNIIEENSADDFNFTISQKCFYNKLKKKIQSKLEFDNRESAEFEAYLLIMSIRTSSYDQQDLIYKFREDEKNNYQLIEALLYCGTFCGESSIVSLEAFRLLNIIFNGSIALSIEPWMLLEIDKQKLKFYNNYADNFVFNPKYLTYQMIHALQIFWDHRYNKESYEMLESEETEFDVSEYYSDITKIDKKNKKKWKRDKGETAIEILQPCLICEPPLSSALNYTATNIFVMLSKYRKDLRNNEEQTVDIRDRMLYIDGTYYNFYNHHFTISKKVRGILDIIKVIIPLPSTDPQYSMESKKRRAPLSGFVVDFFLRMSNPNINVFFNISDKVQLSKISHSELFYRVTLVLNDFIVYKNQLNYDLIPLHILYNIPIHSEIYFNNDINEEEEDTSEILRNKIIIVDELDGIDENRQQKPQRNNKSDNQKSKTKEDLKQTEKRNKSAESDKNDNASSSDDEKNNKSDKIIENESDTNSNSDEEEKPKSNQTNNINEQSKSKESGSNSKLSSDEEEKAISKSKRKSQRDPKKHQKDSDEGNNDNANNKSPSKPNPKNPNKSENNANSNSTDDKENNQSEQEDNSNKSNKIIEKENDTNSNSDEEEKPKSNQTNNINEQSKSKESGSDDKTSSNEEEEKAISKSKRKAISQRDPKKHQKDSDEGNNDNTNNKSPSKPNPKNPNKSENNANSNSTDDKENNQSEQEDNSNKSNKIIEKENDTNSNSDEEEKPKSNQTNNINEQSKSKESGSDDKTSSNEEEEKAISKSKRKAISQRDPKKHQKDSNEEEEKAISKSQRKAISQRNSNKHKNKSPSKPNQQKHKKNENNDNPDSSDNEENNQSEQEDNSNKPAKTIENEINTKSSSDDKEEKRILKSKTKSEDNNNKQNKSTESRSDSKPSSEEEEEEEENISKQKPQLNSKKRIKDSDEEDDNNTKNKSSSKPETKKSDRSDSSDDEEKPKPKPKKSDRSDSSDDEEKPKPKPKPKPKKSDRSDSSDDEEKPKPKPKPKKSDRSDSSGDEEKPKPKPKPKKSDRSDSSYDEEKQKPKPKPKPKPKQKKANSKKRINK